MTVTEWNSTREWSDLDTELAVAMWVQGRSTGSIARSLRCDEADVYNRLGAIKAVARKVKNALACRPRAILDEHSAEHPEELCRVQRAANNGGHHNA